MVLDVGRRRPGGSDYHLSPLPTKLRRYGGIMKVCRLEGCENKYFSLGYCKNHYRKFKKYGNPLYCKIELHGMYGISEYITWQQFKGRCYNKKHKQYFRYGGRGIAVCNRWKNSFFAFYADMGLRPFPKAQIDRIDNDGNYEPGNCRWTTSAQNCRNRSNNKLTLSKVKKIRELYDGNRITQKQLGNTFKINPSLISRIVNNKIWI